MNKFALDTNILIYSHDENAADKQSIARNLIVRSPIVCMQVAIIIAAALDSGCHTLYSEDMQHKMVIDKKLSIINPFL
ncbi:MAG: hypothetical protein FWG84_00160 [Bacteroidales bacterium]|nr:hypothetical protein [Bacteroidales bacterium]